MKTVHAPLAVVVLALGMVCAVQAQPASKPRVKPTAAPERTAAPTPAPEADRADIDRTAIVGNRELPKVLHIVPWKKPLPGELSARPVSSVLDEALAPLDRDVVRRQIDYDAQARAQTHRTTTPR